MTGESLSIPVILDPESEHSERKVSGIHAGTSDTEAPARMPAIL